MANLKKKGGISGKPNVIKKPRPSKMMQGTGKGRQMGKK